MNTITTPTATFEVGKTYFCRSACDYDCIWLYKIERRTASSIYIRDTFTDAIVRRRIYLDPIYGEECINPMGTYSMHPILNARHKWSA